MGEDHRTRNDPSRRTDPIGHSSPGARTSSATADPTLTRLLDTVPVTPRATG